MAASVTKMQVAHDDGRLRLWSALTLLWSVDALLKLQPRMFSAALFVDVLGPVAVDGQPPWLYHLLNWFDGIWVRHMALGEWSVFAIEAAVALLLWFGPDRRPGRLGLLALVVWGILLWVFGEGFGGLFTGDASVLSEAPGAGLLYSAMAALLLAPPPLWRDGTMARGLRLAMGVFWGLAALLELSPDFWTGPGLAGVFGDVTMNGTLPAWAAFLNNLTIVAAFRHPVLLNALFVAVMLALAGGLVLGHLVSEQEGLRLDTFLKMLGLAWSLFLWVFPQAFGGLPVGTATDPGTAPLLAILTLTALEPSRGTRHTQRGALGG